MVKRGTRWFLIACVAAALAPLAVGGKPASPGIKAITGFPGWPTTFENRALTRLPLSALEERFARDFPGHIARFTDGKREIIMRWVAHPTRKLHPAADCFRANGYTVTPRPIRETGGQRWATFLAAHGKRNFLVSERIHDQNGRQWSDVSAWYWANQMDDGGASWAITVAQRY
ncbi:MAG: hypothetical protein A3I66_19575 [Burkholderiales bacterium RIFCSPLOWO2_02_FULL_57_36]|nr:MAG: hypothetical protein A3I66_19575 [Burkholderiales bacterium RIFCSPLOWO2_02_FULL_57_36]